MGKRLNVTLPCGSTRRCPSLCFFPAIDKNVLASLVEFAPYRCRHHRRPRRLRYRRWSSKRDASARRTFDRLEIRLPQMFALLMTLCAASIQVSLQEYSIFARY